MKKTRVKPKPKPKRRKGQQAKENFIRRLETFKECCGTCEFNFDGICAGGDYGAEIYNLNNVCEAFHIGQGSYMEFSELGRLDLLEGIETD